MNVALGDGAFAYQPAVPEPLQAKEVAPADRATQWLVILDEDRDGVEVRDAGRAVAINVYDVIEHHVMNRVIAGEMFEGFQSEIPC